MLRLPEMLATIDDHNIHGQFITETFLARHFYTIANPEKSMDEAIEHFRISKDLDREARLYYAVATYYFHRIGDQKKAQNFYGLRGLVGLATIEFLHGNYSESLRLARKTHRIAIAAGNVWGELFGIRWQALCYGALGDFKRSVQWVNEGKDLVLWAGMQGGELESLLMNIEAEVYHLKTEYAEARHIHEVILRQTSAVLSPVVHAQALANIASLDIVTGASTDIVSHNLNTATTAFRSSHSARGDTIGARAEYMRLFAGLQSNDNELACLCLVKLADPTHLMDADGEVGRWAVVFLAFTMCPLARKMLAVHQALRCLGDVFAQQGTNDVALSILAVALDGFTWMDVHRSRAECMRTIGDVHMRRGDHCAAKEMWTAARPLFERSKQTRDVARIDERLRMLSGIQN
ncbi:hypothetical protein B0H14DRAFT_3476289 [Mycena olivaceomarginata]|nr:hypothetical protein B0H14DRAFT_3476289 [Mycena olivaceomarginata]